MRRLHREARLVRSDRFLEERVRTAAQRAAQVGGDWLDEKTDREVVIERADSILGRDLSDTAVLRDRAIPPHHLGRQ